MSRLDDQGAALVADLQAWLFDANEDVLAAPTATQRWLNEAPREEIRQARGYVKPNPRNAVAMFLAGQAHDNCPDECDGCRCFLSAPCCHCTDHEPVAACGCPHYQLEDTGIHEDGCALPAAVGSSDKTDRED